MATRDGGAFSQCRVYSKYLAWREVARGGIEYEDTAPSTVLDTWLKVAHEDKGKGVKPGDFYHAGIFAWNAFRAGKAITTIKKFDPDKGWPTPAH
jgi:hypothetical protein